MHNSKAYAATSATSPLAGTTIVRRDPTEHDMQIEILFCGICHSDLHSVRNEWSEFMPTVYPIVPGHEIIGRVTTTGSAVTKYKTGDLVAVGCLVDSDRTCPQCKAGLENFCPDLRFTFNSPDKYLGGMTTVAIQTASSSTSISRCASHPTSISPGRRRSSAPGSRHTRPCVTGVSQRAKKLEWSVLADWATWP